MATSGTFDFNLTISEFITRALGLAGIVGEGEVANSAQFADGFTSLNLMTSQLEVNDIPLWKRDFYEFTPVNSSFVTNNSVQYRCLKGHTSVADNEPGVGDLTELYWKEDDSANAVPTAWGLGNPYVTSIEFTVPAKFYDILFATVVQVSGNEVPIDIISFKSYGQDINSKRTSTSSVLPTHITFDNKLPDNTGFIYPQPTLEFESSIRIFGVVKPEDSVNVGDNVDIPARYVNMLSYMVALDLAYMYQKDGESIALLTRQASYYHDQYKKSNREFTSTYLAKGAY